MPYPVVDITQVQSLLWEQLNTATVDYGVFNDDANGNPRWQQAATLDWILDADYLVSKTICESAGHPSRNCFETTVTLNHGDPLPVDMIGPMQAIYVLCADGVSRAGIPCPTDLISAFRNPLVRNPVYGGALFCDTHYQVIDNRCFFSGQSVTVKYCTAVRGTTVCISPAWYKDTVLKLALASPLVKEEEYFNAGQFFLQQGMADLQSIAQRTMIVPPFQAWQQRGQAA